jgi:hypothetical protein
MLANKMGEVCLQVLVDNNVVAMATANAAAAVAAKAAKALAEGNAYNEVKDVVDWLFFVLLVRSMLRKKV